MAARLPKILSYVAWYLTGILAAIVLTPVSAVFLNVYLWPYFIALPGVSSGLFYTLASDYVLGSTPIYWLIYIGGLLSLLIGLTTLSARMHALRRFRPALTGLPLGFVGAMGVFHTVAASI